ncbi:MAG TPA: hypothetical protein VIX82_01495 [Solirubrobacteraceae bacterium]
MHRWHRRARRRSDLRPPGRSPPIQGDFGDAATYHRVAQAIGDTQRPVFYLEIPPFLFGTVIKGLSEAGLTTNARVVVEKPFGHDLASARALAADIHQYIDESQLYRIDHYLGKKGIERGGRGLNHGLAQLSLCHKHRDEASRSPAPADCEHDARERSTAKLERPVLARRSDVASARAVVAPPPSGYRSRTKAATSAPSAANTGECECGSRPSRWSRLFAAVNSLAV